MGYSQKILRDRNGDVGFLKTGVWRRAGSVLKIAQVCPYPLGVRAQCCRGNRDGETALVLFV